MFQSIQTLRRVPVLFEEDQNDQNDYNSTDDLDENNSDMNGEDSTGAPPHFGAPRFTPPPKIEFTDHAPIERKGLRGSAAIIMYALLTVALVCLPLSAIGLIGLIEGPLFNVIGIALSVGLLVYVSRSAKHASGIVPLIVFIGILLFTMTGTIAPTLFLVASVFFISQGAFLLVVIKKSQFPLFALIPIVACGISFALAYALGTTNVLLCTVCLLPVPGTVVLAATTHSAAKRGGITRVGSICASSLALGATVVAALAVGMYLAFGNISLDSINAAMDSFRNVMFESLTSFSADLGNGTEQIMSDEMALELVNATINILPGATVTLINILVFVAQVLLLGSLRTWKVIDKPVRKMFEFSMSFMSAIVFAVALVILIVDSGYEKSTLVGTVASNLAVIFQPGLALCGVNSLTKHMVEKRRGCGFVTFFGLLLIMSVVINTLLTVLSAMGAFFIIKDLVTDITAKKKGNRQS